MSVTTATEIGTGGKHVRGAAQRDAADGDERAVDLLAPLGNAGKTLRRPGHRFQLGRVDGPERDIVGLGVKRGLQLLRGYAC